MPHFVTHFVFTFMLLQNFKVNLISLTPRGPPAARVPGELALQLKSLPQWVVCIVFG